MLLSRAVQISIVTLGAILYKVTFDQRSMFFSHHGLLLLVNFDLQLGFYIHVFLFIDCSWLNTKLLLIVININNNFMLDN